MSTRSNDALLTLRDADARSEVTIAPWRGALVTSFKVRDRELLYLDRSTFDDLEKNVRGGVPVLFPAPGELEGQSWAWRGHHGAMKQHGFARTQSWAVVKADGHSAVLTLKDSPATLAQYPWHFAVELHFTLRAAAVRIEMVVTNTSDSVMPFAIGYHPYFHVNDKAAVKIPSGATRAFNKVKRVIEPFTGFDLTQPEVDMHLLDHREQHATLIDSDGTAISVSASPEFRYWIVWTVAGKDYVCLEPWTAQGNALNTGTYLTELPPGQTHRSWIEIARTDS